MANNVNCSNCELVQRCIWRDRSRGPDLTGTARVYHDDDIVFAAGDVCDSLNVVRSGVLKSYAISAEGEEQILGFHYPGSVVGLEGFGDGAHQMHAQSVGTTSVCILPRDRLVRAASADPSIFDSFIRIAGMSAKAGTRSQLHLGTLSAEQKIATFLLETAEQYATQGCAVSEIRLPMRRRDIARHLALAIETVSRTFKRLEKAGVVSVNAADRHLISIPSIADLETLAERSEALAA